MTISKILEPYVCGGTAATFGSCCIHPIDLAKVGLACRNLLSAPRRRFLTDVEMSPLLCWQLRPPFLSAISS
jgi:hypothetical protein